MRPTLFAIALIVAGLGGESVWGETTDGSILVLHNSNKIVGTSTASSITHVAMVLNINGLATVYEATPAKVRKLPLSQYYHEIGELNRNRKKKMRIEMRQPRKELTAFQKDLMLSFLNDQIGRRYSVRGYLRKSPGDGIHCAALVGSALTESGKARVVNPYGQNPATLMLGLRSEYAPGKVVAVAAKTPDPTWCERWTRSWQGFRMWCSWSFVESFRFCF